MPTHLSRCVIFALALLAATTALAGPLLGELPREQISGQRLSPWSMPLDLQTLDAALGLPDARFPGLASTGFGTAAPAGAGTESWAKAAAAPAWSPFNAVITRRNDGATQPGAYALLGGALLLAAITAGWLTWGPRRPSTPN